jgi:hypothetical protein
MSPAVKTPGTFVIQRPSPAPFRAHQRGRASSARKPTREAGSVDAQRLPLVADIEDVLQGKIWAAQDPERRTSKRQKDLADIARLIEAEPALRARVPQDLLARLV